MKFALAGGASLLDKMPLPEIFQSGPAAQSTADFMHSVDMYNQGMGVSSSAAMMGMASSGSFEMGGGKRGHKQRKKKPSLQDSQVEERELTVDGVLDKIRRNRGDKQTWTDEKLQALVAPRDS